MAVQIFIHLRTAAICAFALATVLLLIGSQKVNAEQVFVTVPAPLGDLDQLEGIYTTDGVNVISMSGSFQCTYTYMVMPYLDVDFGPPDYMSTRMIDKILFFSATNFQTHLLSTRNEFIRSASANHICNQGRLIYQPADKVLTGGVSLNRSEPVLGSSLDYFTSGLPFASIIDPLPDTVNLTRTNFSVGAPQREIWQRSLDMMTDCQLARRNSYTDLAGTPQGSYVRSEACDPKGNPGPNGSIQKMIETYWAGFNEGFTSNGRAIATRCYIRHYYRPCTLSQSMPNWPPAGNTLNYNTVNPLYPPDSVLINNAAQYPRTFWTIDITQISYAPVNSQNGQPTGIDTIPQSDFGIDIGFGAWVKVVSKRHAGSTAVTNAQDFMMRRYPFEMKWGNDADISVTPPETPGSANTVVMTAYDSPTTVGVDQDGPVSMGGRCKNSPYSIVNAFVFQSWYGFGKARCPASPYVSLVRGVTVIEPLGLQTTTFNGIDNFPNPSYFCDYDRNSSLNGVLAYNRTFLAPNSETCEGSAFDLTVKSWILNDTLRSTQDSGRGPWGSFCHVRIEFTSNANPMLIPDEGTGINRGCSCNQYNEIKGVTPHINHTTLAPTESCHPDVGPGETITNETTCVIDRYIASGTECSCGSQTCKYDYYVHSTIPAPSGCCDLFPTDCTVGEWRPNGSCSTTCGTGNLTQVRDILEPLRTARGAPCPYLSRVIECSNTACNVSCTLTDWTDSTSCSPACVSLNSSTPQTKLRQRSIIDPGDHCNAVLQEEVACSPRIICPPDENPVPTNVFSRFCNNGELPQKLLDGTLSCFMQCPDDPNADSTDWAQFWPCRRPCDTLTAITECPLGAFECWQEYTTPYLLPNLYSDPVYVAPPTINCVTERTAICSGAQMNAACAKTVTNCVVRTFSNGSSPVVITNCSADFNSMLTSINQTGLGQCSATYGCLVAVMPCDADQLARSCFRDASKCRVFYDEQGNSRQFIDCPWGSNLFWDDSVTGANRDPRIPPNPLVEVCTDQESVRLCGPAWIDNPHRRPCTKQIRLYSEWYESHLYSYSDKSTSCKLDVCSNIEWVCMDRRYAPLCTQSRLDTCSSSINSSSTCSVCSNVLDLTTQLSRRCTYDEMILTGLYPGCERCRVVRSPGSSDPTPTTIETDCGYDLTLVAPGTSRVVRPANVGWNRQFVSPTFFRECTQQETARMCGIGIYINPLDPSWIIRRCALVGNSKIGAYRLAKSGHMSSSLTASGCWRQGPVVDTHLEQVTSTLCTANGDWSGVPVCPTPLEIATAAGNDTVFRLPYLQSFALPSSAHVLNRNGTYAPVIRHCTDSEWKGTASCARFHSECRAVLNYHTISGQLLTRFEHKCHYTPADDWETEVHVRLCETSERQATCAVAPEDCRIVFRNSSRILGTGVKYALCPGTTSYEIDALSPLILPCNRTEADAYCPTQDPLWNPDTLGGRGGKYAICSKTNCTSMGQCFSKVPGSCFQRDCTTDEQLALCGGFNHQCSVNCGNSSQGVIHPFQCSLVGGSCGPITSDRPVRKCTEAEFQTSCANTREDCRVQCDDTSFSTNCVKTFMCSARKNGDTSYSTSVTYPNYARPLSTMSQAREDCGPLVGTQCVLGACDFTWAAGERCRCDLSTCQCASGVFPSTTGKPCVNSTFYGRCSNQLSIEHETRLCGRFVQDCSLNCTGGALNPVCTGVQCSCQAGAFPWMNLPCEGFEVPCEQPTYEMCGPRAIKCHRVVSLSRYSISTNLNVNTGFSTTTNPSDYWRCTCGNGTVITTGNYTTLPLDAPERQSMCEASTVVNCSSSEALAACGMSTASCLKDPVINMTMNTTCKCPTDGSAYSLLVGPGLTKCYPAANGTSVVACSSSEMATCSVDPESQCRKQCNTTTNACTIIPNTCFVQVSGRVPCTVDVALHFCGQNFVKYNPTTDPSSGGAMYRFEQCSIVASYRQDIGFYGFNASSVVCGGCPNSSSVLLQAVLYDPAARINNTGTAGVSFEMDWWNDYGRCMDPSSIVRPCRPEETARDCFSFNPSSSSSSSSLYLASPSTASGRIRVRDQCLRTVLGDELVPYSCPYTQSVRACTPAEVFRYCPDPSVLPNLYPHCMVECDASDPTKCRRFGECGTYVEGANCADYCPGACVSSTVVRTQTERSVSLSLLSGTCTYTCPAQSAPGQVCTSSSFTSNCTQTSADACGVTGSTLACWNRADSSLKFRTCMCRAGYGALNPPELVRIKDNSGDVYSVTYETTTGSDQLGPCSGLIVPCDDANALLLAGPYYQPGTCFMTTPAIPSVRGSPRLYNVTCTPQGRARRMSATTSGKAIATAQPSIFADALVPYVDQPCGANWDDVNMDPTKQSNVTAMYDVCGTDTLTCKVRRFLGPGGIVTSSIVTPGSCVCSDHRLSFSLELKCNSTFYYQPCASTEYNELPWDLRNRDCRPAQTQSREQFALVFPTTSTHPYANPSYSQGRMFRVLNVGNGTVYRCQLLRGNECIRGSSLNTSVLITNYPNSTLQCFKDSQDTTDLIKCTTRSIYYYKAGPATTAATVITARNAYYFGEEIMCQTMAGRLCTNETYPVQRASYIDGAQRIVCKLWSLDGLSHTPIPCQGEQYAYYRIGYFSWLGNVTCETLMGDVCSISDRKINATYPLTMDRASPVWCFRSDANGVSTLTRCYTREVEIVEQGVWVQCEDFMSSYCTTMRYIYGPATRKDIWLDGTVNQRKSRCSSWLGAGDWQTADCGMFVHSAGFLMFDWSGGYERTTSIYEVIYGLTYSFKCGTPGAMLCFQRRMLDGSVYTKFRQEQGEYMTNRFQGSLTSPPITIPISFPMMYANYTPRVPRWDPVYIQCVVATDYKGAFLNYPMNSRHNHTSSLCITTQWFWNAQHPATVEGDFMFPANTEWWINATSIVMMWRRLSGPEWGERVGRIGMSGWAKRMYVGAERTLCSSTYFESTGRSAWQGELGQRDHCHQNLFARDNSVRDCYAVAMDGADNVYIVSTGCRWREALFTVNGQTVKVWCDHVLGDICMHARTEDVIAYNPTYVGLQSDGASIFHPNVPVGLYSISGKWPGSINTGPATQVSIRVSTLYTSNLFPIPPTQQNGEPFYRTVDSDFCWDYTQAKYRVLNTKRGQVLCDPDRFEGDYCTSVYRTGGIKEDVFVDSPYVVGMECWQGSASGTPWRIPCPYTKARYVNNQGFSLIPGFPADAVDQWIGCSSAGVSSGECQNKISQSDLPLRPLVSYGLDQALQFKRWSTPATQKLSKLDTTPDTLSLRRAFFQPPLGPDVGWVVCDHLIGEWCRVQLSIYAADDVRCFGGSDGNTEVQCGGQSLPAGWPTAFAPAASQDQADTPVRFTTDQCFRKRSVLTNELVGYKTHACLDTYFDDAGCSAHNLVNACGPFADTCRGRCAYLSDTSTSTGIVQHCSEITACTCVQTSNSIFPGDRLEPCGRDYVTMNIETRSVCSPLCGSTNAGCRARCRVNKLNPSAIQCYRAEWCKCSGTGSSEVMNPTGNPGVPVYQTCSGLDAIDTCVPEEQSCGIYTRLATRSCIQGSKSAADCITECECVEGGVEYTPGVACSGYGRSCTSLEVAHYCTGTLNMNSYTSCSLHCARLSGNSNNETCYLKPGSCQVSVTAGSTSVKVLSISTDGLTWRLCNQTERLQFCGSGTQSCKVDKVNGTFVPSSCMCDFVNGGRRVSSRKWSYPSFIELTGVEPISTQSPEFFSFLETVLKPKIGMAPSDQFVGLFDSESTCNLAGGKSVRVDYNFYQCSCKHINGSVMLRSKQKHEDRNFECSIMPTWNTYAPKTPFDSNLDQGVIKTCYKNLVHRDIRGFTQHPPGWDPELLIRENPWLYSSVDEWDYDNGGVGTVQRGITNSWYPLWSSSGTLGNVNDRRHWKTEEHTEFFMDGPQIVYSRELYPFGLASWVDQSLSKPGVYAHRILDVGLVDAPFTGIGTKAGLWSRMCQRRNTECGGTFNKWRSCRQLYQCSHTVWIDCTSNAPPFRRYIDVWGRDRDDVVPDDICPAGWTPTVVVFPFDTWYEAADPLNDDDWWDVSALVINTPQISAWGFVTLDPNAGLRFIPPPLNRAYWTRGYWHSTSAVPVKTADEVRDYLMATRARAMLPSASSPTYPVFSGNIGRLGGGIEDIGLSFCMYNFLYTSECDRITQDLNRCRACFNNNHVVPCTPDISYDSAIQGWGAEYGMKYCDEEMRTLTNWTAGAENVYQYNDCVITVAQCELLRNKLRFDLTCDQMKGIDKWAGPPGSTGYIRFIDVVPGDAPKPCSWEYDDIDTSDLYLEKERVYSGQSQFMCIKQGEVAGAGDACSLSDSIASEIPAECVNKPMEEYDHIFTAQCGWDSMGCRQRDLWVRDFVTKEMPDIQYAVDASGTLSAYYAGDVYDRHIECLCVLDRSKPFKGDNLVYSSVLTGYAIQHYAYQLSLFGTSRTLVKQGDSELVLQSDICDSMVPTDKYIWTYELIYTRNVIVYHYNITDICFGRGTLPVRLCDPYSTARCYDLAANCTCVKGFTGEKCQFVDIAYPVVHTITGCGPYDTAPCGVQAVLVYQSGLHYYYEQTAPVRNFFLAPPSVITAACGDHGRYDWENGTCVCETGYKSQTVSGKCVLACNDGKGCSGRGSCSPVDQYGWSYCVCDDKTQWAGPGCNTSASLFNCGSDCGGPDRGVCTEVSELNHQCVCKEWTNGMFVTPQGGAPCSSMVLKEPLASICSNRQGTPYFISPVAGFGCACPSGWTGPHCNISRCASNPLHPMNGLVHCSGDPAAVCVPKDNTGTSERWKCSACSTGIKGCACDINVRTSDYCGLSECGIAGTCSRVWDSVQQRSTYKCKCIEGYTGKECTGKACAPTDLANRPLPLPTREVCNGFPCNKISPSMCDCANQKRFDGDIHRFFMGAQCDVEVTSNCVNPVGNTGARARSLCSDRGRCVCNTTLASAEYGTCADNGVFRCECAPGSSGEFCELQNCIATDYTCGGPSRGTCDVKPAVPVSNPESKVCSCVNPRLWNKSSDLGPCTVNMCNYNGLVAATPYLDGPTKECRCDNPILQYVSTSSSLACKSSVCPVHAASGAACGPRYAWDPIVNDFPGINPLMLNTEGVRCERGGDFGPPGICSCVLNKGYRKNEVTGMCEQYCNPTGTSLVVPIAQDPSFRCVCKGDHYGDFCDIPWCAVLTNETTVCDPARSICSCKPLATRGGVHNQIDLCAAKGLSVIPESNYTACRCNSTGLWTGALCDAQCMNKATAGVWPDLSCHCTAMWEGTNCETSKCKHGSTLDSVTKTKCNCVGNYKGVFCDRCLNGWTGSDCGVNLCMNGGEPYETVVTNNCTCRPGTNQTRCSAEWCLENTGEPYNIINPFNCTCRPHTTGYRCEQCTKNWGGYLCMTSLCQNNGTTDELSGECICSSSQFGGDLCHLVKPDCSNGGTANYGDTTCNCIEPGWSGPLCRTPSNPCSRPDLGHYYNYSSKTCACFNHMAPNGLSVLATYTGRLCQNEFLVCYNNGTLNQTMFVNPTCINCLTGFGGPNCLTPVNPCRNGGSVNYTDNTCMCPEPFAGALCEINTHPCYHNSTYRVYPNHTCQCDFKETNPYLGPHCNITTQPGSRCLNNAFYNWTTDTCECDRGTSTTKYWTGYVCDTWVLPCQHGTSPSVFNVSSITHCDCPEGILEGQFCETFTNVCANGGTVSQVDGSCNCTSFWTGPRCTDWVLPCQNGGTYVNDSSLDYCNCSLTSPLRSGQFCQYYANTCHHFTTFNRNTGVCTCEYDGRNFFWTGSQCDVWSPPCTHGSIPIAPNAQGYVTVDQTCDCSPGFHGQFCELWDNYCQNGGIVSQTNGVCGCTPLWNGYDCTTFVNPCSSVPNSTWSSYLCPARGCRYPYDGVCECPVGYTGPQCNIRLAPALPVACLNGGSFNNHQCVCKYPFHGDRCAENLCVTRFANAYLDCSGSGGGTQCRCTCLPGWGGADCSTDIDPQSTQTIANIQCLNGGYVSNVTGACVCPDPNYDGPTCQRRICGAHGSVVSFAVSTTCACRGYVDYKSLNVRWCELNEELLRGPCSSSNRFLTYYNSERECRCDEGWDFINRRSTLCEKQVRRCGVNGVNVPIGETCVCTAPHVLTTNGTDCELPCANGVYDRSRDLCVCPAGTDLYGRLCQYSRAEILRAANLDNIMRAFMYGETVSQSTLNVLVVQWVNATTSDSNSNSTNSTSASVAVTVDNPSSGDSALEDDPQSIDILNQLTSSASTFSTETAASTNIGDAAAIAYALQTETTAAAALLTCDQTILGCATPPALSNAIALEQEVIAAVQSLGDTCANEPVCFGGMGTGGCYCNPTSVLISPTPAPTTSNKDDKVEVIAGSVAGSVAFVALVIAIIWTARKRGWCQRTDSRQAHVRID